MERKKWEETKKDCALAVFFEGAEKEENLGENSLPVLLWNYLERTVVGNDGVPEGEGGRSSSLLVTDFSWWRVMPKMGILQFKSREKANQVYTQLMEVERASEGPVKIGSYSVEFMKLVDLPESTWKNLLPEDTIEDSQSSASEQQPSTSQESPPVKKRKINTSSCSPADDHVTGNHTKQKTLTKPFNNSGLVTQFKSILKFVEISTIEYQQAQQIIEQVKTLISSEYPSCEVLLFRHNFLKIRDPFCNDLLLFAHGGHISTSTNLGYHKLDISEVGKLAVVKDPTLFYIYEEDPKYQGSQQFELLSNPDGPSLRNFWIITDEAYLLEVQLNRLLQYMTTFDPKCSILLSILRYFCTLNSCYLCADNSHSKTEAMEWLLIFLLSKSKVIPTVREILDQPHQPIILPNSEGNIDIGFNPDPEFANKWKTKNKTKIMDNYTEEFVCDVLELFKKFLRFFSRSLRDGNFILNIRDAENLNRKQVLFQSRKKWTTKLSSEEIEIIKSNPKHGGESNIRPFNIVHPLNVHLNLEYDKGSFLEALKIVRPGWFHLNRFLNLRRKAFLQKWIKKNGEVPKLYEDLRNVLKIQGVPEAGPKYGNKKERKRGNSAKTELIKRKKRMREGTVKSEAGN